ncbi:hypothetical protein PTT_11604 [Pyrenophora teres f. teres 0-1]|uniref:Reverse transcriptase domain-containing protein n=1 Tax=Pyrenophora teres f. teres (strain 0-1) TaxID=861557 RepID=E3RRW5_PYRTT|nr:hypothetical protein PTT_11604 [Pyrenophora teres f. teres 0-1]
MDNSLSHLVWLILRDFLDDFASAYLDDILIYTDGSLSQHHSHVQQVIKRL